MKKKSEFQTFDDAMRKILTVSHDELRRREEQWKQEREEEKKRKAKSSASGRASRAGG